jgi:diacylglycerol kinase family enzyme
LRTHTSHEIGLGNAVFTDVHEDTHSHWFTINAGLGLDAAVIEAMEAQRAKGRAATPLRYVRTGIGVYARDRERTKPALTIEIPGQDPITDIALVITQNTAPWTFLGPFAVNPCPKASFDRGLDVFAPHSLGLPSTVRFGLRMLRASPAGGVSGGLTALHDISEFSVHASRPTALQIDGDGMGNVTHVDFKSVPQALRILG